MSVVCPYCESESELVRSSEVYAKDYGWIYLCRPCKAWVGCHGNGKKPLGRLANSELRKWKMTAHGAFDHIWKSRKMRRGQAYGWLAEQLGIDNKDCHVGMFDVETCKRVVDVCERYRGLHKQRVPESALIKLRQRRATS